MTRFWIPILILLVLTACNTSDAELVIPTSAFDDDVIPTVGPTEIPEFVHIPALPIPDSLPSGGFQIEVAGTEALYYEGTAEFITPYLIEFQHPEREDVVTQLRLRDTYTIGTFPVRLNVEFERPDLPNLRQYGAALILGEGNNFVIRDGTLFLIAITDESMTGWFTLNTGTARGDRVLVRGVFHDVPIMPLDD